MDLKRRELIHSAVTRYIVGYKKEESDFLLKFLFDHVAQSQDLQTRVRWRQGTVVVWDVSSIHTHTHTHTHTHSLSLSLSLSLPGILENANSAQNRVTLHSALFDWEDGQRRHLARITPQAEAPYETAFEGEKQ